MKALSIQQPWASMILCEGKDIENRTWETKIRGRIFIHVGKNYSVDGHLWIENHFGIKVPAECSVLLGGIIGSVEIVDCVTSHDSKWFFGPFGFVLKNPIVLPFRECKGRLGFFEVDYKNAV